MKLRLVRVAGLVLALGVLAGCRRTELVSRPLAPHEASWDQAIRRWYPRWPTPYFSPVRDTDTDGAPSPGLIPGRDFDQPIDEEVELVPAVRAPQTP